MLGRQGLDDPVLAAVGVLILVYQEVVEPAGLFAPRGGIALEEFLGTQQQVVEIDGPGGLQRLLIPRVGRRGQVFAVGPCRIHRPLRPDR